MASALDVNLPEKDVTEALPITSCPALVISCLTRGDDVEDTLLPAQRPYMLLLPDIDGMGATSARIWPRLAARLDLHVLRIEAHFEGAFKDLVAFVAARVRADLAQASPERPTYILGDGFGGLLALAVALECGVALVHRLVLVNPTTCLKDVPLRRIGPLLAALPPPLMRAAPLGIVPLLGGKPSDLLAHIWGGAQHAGVGAAGAAALQALLGTMEQLQLLTRHLQPHTLMARLALLDQGVRHMQGRLREVEARVMVLAGGRDALLPSGDEAQRLVAALPRAFHRTFPDAGHALLLDPSVDLLAVMRAEGFLLARRKFSSPVKRGGPGVVFGAPGPIELPSRQEVARAGRFLTTPLRQLCSPVFFSTRPDGTVVEGLAGLDTSALPHRPLVLVGNHQLYALDMNVLAEEVYLQKGILLRGLAHPALFRQTLSDAERATAAGTAPGSGGPSAGLPENNILDALPLARESGPRAGPLGDIYRTFGAVPVSPSAFFKLLAAGEAVLLYPGGIREGFKRRNERYKLFWPERGEFVRMAARHSAIVVPVSAVGWEDCVDIVMDSDEVAAHPWLGPRFRASAAAAPRARANPTTTAPEVDEAFIPPLIAPARAARLLFLLGRPVQLHAALCRDREGADAQYHAIRDAVEAGIQWLLAKREEDPFKDAVRRLIYENNPVLNAARKRAPTFPLDPPAQV